MNREEIEIRPFHWYLGGLILVLTISLGVTTGSLRHVLQTINFVMVCGSIVVLYVPITFFSFVQSQSIWLTGVMAISSFILWILVTIGVAVS